MSYYILPKTNNNIYINPVYDKKQHIPYISHTLSNYYNDTINELTTIFSSNGIESSYFALEDFIKIINPYEYIYSVVPGSKFSVSKLKPKSNLFYELLEIITTLNVIDLKQLGLQMLHITPNSDDIVQCMELLRENHNDTKFCFNEIDDLKNNLIHTNIKDIDFDFIFFESYNSSSSINIYIINLIQTIMVIFKRLKSGGTCIIKIDCVFHKPIIDILYLLTSCFEKIYIIKPNTSNITTFEKYIVCKYFITNEQKIKLYKNNYNILNNCLINLEDNNIISLINSNTSCHFINKLNDINTIIGQQQLESLNQIINILKSRNKDEKIELIKKTNIQKAVNWCEKFKLPCNKFTEKTNIFLPIIKEEYKEEYKEENYDANFYIEEINDTCIEEINDTYIEEINANYL